MHDPAIFAAALLAVLCCPGPTNTLLATAGVTSSFLRSLPLLLAESAGYASSIAAIHLALSPLGLDGAGVRIALRVLAGAYLMWLAIKIWRTPPLSSGTTVTPRRVFLTTLLNPKGLLFALVIIPFGAADVALYLVAMWITLPLVGSAWIAGGAALRRATAHSQLLPRAAALVLGAFSTALLLSPLLR